MKYRSLRVANLIRDELGKIILKELEFPNAIPTITQVEIDEKLEAARIKVSVIPSSESEKALKILQEAQRRFQHLLLKKINIKPMPKIRFEIDHGPEAAARVEKILLEEDNK